MEEAVSPGALRHVLSTLPDEFNALFAAAHEGQFADNGSVSREQIAQRAHAIWEQSGRPEGGHLEHWLRAETELQQGRSDESGAIGNAAGQRGANRRRSLR